jgi:hypothetical protein
MDRSWTSRAEGRFCSRPQTDRLDLPSWLYHSSSYRLSHRLSRRLSLTREQPDTFRIPTLEPCLAGLGLQPFQHATLLKTPSFPVGVSGKPSRLSVHAFASRASSTGYLSTAPIRQMFVHIYKADKRPSCQNELRQCFQGNEADNIFQSALFSWSQDCIGYITYSPTTPVLTTLATDIPAFCGTQVEAACNEAEEILGACETITNSAKFSSCLCQPQFLSQDYTCEYLGNVTCLSTTAAFTNLIGSSACSNFGQYIGPHIVSQLLDLSGIQRSNSWARS